MIQKPIFIVGASRSGTTLLYHLLAVHPDVCWFSVITDAVPGFPQASALHRMLDIPVIGEALKREILRATKGKDIFISPSEAPVIYDDYCGFTNAKISTASDLTPLLKTRFERVVTNHLRYTGKRRFVNKKPENIQRIRLINAIFPDAVFIHIIRDGRAVVNSLMKSHWWPDAQLWWRNGTRPSDADNANLNPVDLCAQHWANNVGEVYKNKKILGGRYFEVQYETLVQDVHGTIRRILSFAGLRPDASYLSLLPSQYPSMNPKWKQELSSAQKRRLQKTLKASLALYGYE